VPSYKVAAHAQGTASPGHRQTTKMTRSTLHDIAEVFQVIQNSYQNPEAAPCCRNCDSNGAGIDMFVMRSTCDPILLSIRAFEIGAHHRGTITIAVSVSKYAWMGTLTLTNTPCSMCSPRKLDYPRHTLSRTQKRGRSLMLKRLPGSK
jgi:hypothetical protein